MPYNEKKQIEAIEAMIRRAEEKIYNPLCEIGMEVYVTPEPVPFGQRTAGERRTVKKGDVWGKVWDCGWFHFTGTVPEEAKGQKAVLYIDVHGELCVFDEAGVPVRGLTSGSSNMNPACGNPRKREYVISESASGGEKIDIWADAGCNDLFGVRPNLGEIEYADICICREDVKGLYYDASILFDLMKEYSQDSARYQKLLRALFDASCALYEFTEDEVKAARTVLARELDKKGGDPDFKLSAVGHAHIDLAWLWPIRETKRKGARTFATALRNMERYSGYVFGASQPQLYQWVKEEHPALYAQVQDRIQEGRWEAQGAMWVEADTNVSGGEALVRQVLYGKRFFRQEFGKDMEILWLPDVFGYSGALPQILKKSGVPYFLTIKLSWSQHNKHPHHTFLWRGIDNSEILVHMPPEGEYNSMAMPWSLKKAERCFLDHAVSDEAVMLFGIGDGGGGPGESHLEALEREKNLSGLPPVKQEPALDFFHRLEEGRDRYQTYHGELYLEKHQGTYTTQARNKKYNREMEHLLREVEFAAAATGSEYPQEELERIWKEVLLYQFHDILPGSSIKRVYDESLARYAELRQEAESLLLGCYGGGNHAVNSLSWDRTGWVKRDGRWYRLTVPALGSAELKGGVEAAEAPAGQTDVLENETVLVRFDENGAIVSVYDKRQGCELLEAPSNRFAVYYDDGDCWDFNETYRERPPKYFSLVSSEAFTDGPVKKVVQSYAFGSSRLTQSISITEGSALVEFDTEVDWKEAQKMLRTAFYTSIVTDEATCDIQFGSIRRPTRRNTSWDMAKFEICAHKYLDLSDRNHGAAVLSDCKYGFCALDGMLDINLLRSPSYPGAEADIAVHTFRYGFYPHTGDAAHSDVIQKSYEFNFPLRFGGAISQLAAVSNPDIIVESVKKAEDSGALIFRLYESKGAPAVTKLSFTRPVKEASLTNLMEEGEQPVNLDEIPFRGFEIQTVKVVLG